MARGGQNGSSALLGFELPPVPLRFGPNRRSRESTRDLAVPEPASRRDVGSGEASPPAFAAAVGFGSDGDNDSVASKRSGTVADPGAPDLAASAGWFAKVGCAALGPGRASCRRGSPRIAMSHVAVAIPTAEIAAIANHPRRPRSRLCKVDPAIDNAGSATAVGSGAFAIDGGTSSLPRVGSIRAAIVCPSSSLRTSVCRGGARPTRPRGPDAASATGSAEAGGTEGE